MSGFLLDIMHKLKDQISFNYEFFDQPDNLQIKKTTPYDAFPNTLCSCYPLQAE